MNSKRYVLAGEDVVTTTGVMHGGDFIVEEGRIKSVTGCRANEAPVR